MRIILEGPLLPEQIDTEDGGQAVIVHHENDLRDQTDDGLFVRIQSWDSTREHTEITHLLKAATGKRIRVTIEVV